LPSGQLTPDGYVNMSYHTFLVKTDRYTMLVDTCCGNHKNRAARPEFHQLNTKFLCTLANAGVKPEEVLSCARTCTGIMSAGTRS
jgi:hypothetical protein